MRGRPSGRPLSALQRRPAGADTSTEMPTPLQRVQEWVGVDFTKPDNHLEAAMVRVLVLGLAALAAIGVADLIATRTLESALQPVGATLLVSAAWIMHRTGHARPRALLVIGAVLAFVFIAMAAANGRYLQLTNSSAMLIVTASGVITVSLGGRWAATARLFWFVLTVSGVFVAQWTLGEGAVRILLSMATVVIVLGLIFVTVAAVRSALEHGRLKYERLIDTAPVGVAELDFRGLSTWLRDNDLRSMAQVGAHVGRHPEALEEILASLSVRVVNSHVRRVLGFDAADGEARLDQLLVQGDRATVALGSAAIALGQRSGQVVLDFPDYKGRVRHYVVRWSAQSSDLSDVIFAVVDFTRQKQAEAALEAEIRSKDQFIASVSHELRTPLTAVVGLVEELRHAGDWISDDEREELLEIVAAQSQDVADIVEDLLVAARAAGGTLTVFPQEIDLSETVFNTSRAIDAGFDVVVDGPVAGYADPVRARQIVRNLMTNAVRYGGPQRRVVVLNGGDVVTIEVRDDGTPIPPSIRDTMFLAYERAHSPSATAPESVGLGLTVASSLAQAMGGDLVYDHDGTEAVFRLTLPAAPAVATQHAS